MGRHLQWRKFYPDFYACTPARVGGPGRTDGDLKKRETRSSWTQRAGGTAGAWKDAHTRGHDAGLPAPWTALHLWPQQAGSSQKGKGEGGPRRLRWPHSRPRAPDCPLPAHSLPHIPEKFFTPNSPTPCPHRPKPSQLRPTCIFIAERCLKR